MGFLTPLFQKDIDKAAEQKAFNLLPTLVDARITELMPGLQQQLLGNLYNQNVFQWIGNNQLIIDWEDKYKFVREGFQRNADVYTCIDLIAKKVAECSYTLFEIKSGVTKKELKQYENLVMSDSLAGKLKALQLKERIFEEIKESPILKLLENPNPLQTYEEWMTDIAGFFLCTGDGYIMGNGVSEQAIRDKIWSQLYCLPSHYMKIVSGGVFEPIKGYSLVTVFTEEVPFPASQVQHFKTFNPDFTMTGASLYGQSPIKAIYRNVLKENQGQDELLKQIRNGGAMGFISPDNDQTQLTEKQLGLLHNKIVQAKESEDLADRIFPSTGPLKWTQIGLHSTDLQLIESLNLDTKKIYAAFHVPIQFSGSEAASTDNNMSWASKQLIYNAVSPVLRKIKDALNEFVCRPYARAEGKRYYLDFDISSYQEMQEDLAQLTTWLKQSWWLSPNECRIAQQYDKDPDPLMDKKYAPANLVPLDDLTMDSAYNQPLLPNGTRPNEIP